MFNRYSNCATNLAICNDLQRQKYSRTFSSTKIMFVLFAVFNGTWTFQFNKLNNILGTCWHKILISLTTCALCSIIWLIFLHVRKWLHNALYQIISGLYVILLIIFNLHKMTVVNFETLFIVIKIHHIRCSS